MTGAGWTAGVFPDDRDWVAAYHGRTEDGREFVDVQWDQRVTQRIFKVDPREEERE